MILPHISACLMVSLHLVHPKKQLARNKHLVGKDVDDSLEFQLGSRNLVGTTHSHQLSQKRVLLFQKNQQDICILNHRCSENLSDMSTWKVRIHQSSEDRGSHLDNRCRLRLRGRYRFLVHTIRCQGKLLFLSH